MVSLISRTTVATLGVVCLLTLSTPAFAQNKSSSRASRSNVVRVSGGSSARASAGSSRSARPSSQQSGRKASRSSSGGRSSTARVRSQGNSGRNQARTTRNTNSVRTSNRVRSGGRSVIEVKRGDRSGDRDPSARRQGSGNTARVRGDARSGARRTGTVIRRPQRDVKDTKDGAQRDGADGEKYRSRFRLRDGDGDNGGGGGGVGDVIRRPERRVLDAKGASLRQRDGADRDEITNAFRLRSENRGVEPRRRPDDRRRQADRHRPRTRHRYDHRRYGYGHTFSYYNGYHRGYHYGFHDGYYYGHNHYYGPHLVFGFHYGGFGYYHGLWHFAIVIGSPIVVYDRHAYYNYTWWDGRGSTLMTWDNAVQAYPADYRWDLSRKNCVALWITTTDGENYEVKIDPAYWNAQDPGELYAALWSELDQNGRLELEDENGVIHVYPAGLIQQIEASACR